jgi:serine/threonine protein kinase
MVVAGRFEIEGLAGQGGMGTVFQARDRQDGGLVALKLLDTPAPERRNIERLLREAQLLATLRHPSVVRYVAHGQMAEGQVFLAMEWLDGEDLGQRLRRGPLAVSESLQLVCKVAEVLAMVHTRGILHRDIKPSNLFLRGRHVSEVVLLDFGIARGPFGQGTMTRTGEVMGTLLYLSPEQARGERQLDVRTDIYSLGCVLFECLTGKAPFGGDHPGVILARILCEEAPPLGRLRPDLPEPLAALVARMLAKQPADRWADAEQLLAALAAQMEVLRKSQAPPPGSPLSPAGEGPLGVQAAGRPPVFADKEQRLVSVIMAAPPPTPDGGPEVTRDSSRLEGERRSDTEYETLRRLLASCGGHIERVATGMLVATLGQSGASAVDLATQAARCALLLQEHLPTALVVLGMGRATVSAGFPIGEAIERAVELLERSRDDETARAAGRVRVDELTAGLLDQRFHLRRLAPGLFVLDGERRGPDEVRLLFGRPTPCVGREQELMQLETLLGGCITEEAAIGVLVTSAPGMGKSRLRQEFIRRVQMRAEGVEVLYGCGDPMPGEPVGGLLGQALRRLCGVDEGAPLERRREQLAARLGRHLDPAARADVAAFLGELCSVPWPDDHSPRLRAARQDPRLMSERIAEALVTLLRAECKAHPVLLVLEDLHWSDATQVRLVDRMLRDLSDHPFFMLALGRPEVRDQFPRLWQGRNVQELRLPGLSRKASERLVRQALGAQVPPATLARIVEQAGGNALFLEELIRAVAEGAGDELPETVLAMLQARFLRLDPGARRLLRAASVFGSTFWRGGVMTLLGGAVHAPTGPAAEPAPEPAPEIARWLDILVDAETIVPHAESRFPGEIEYSFRHALLHDAAYSLLDEQDRLAGHRLAGAYLDRLGETDPLTLAEHYRLGGDLERAAVLYARAAEQSLLRQSAMTLTYVERAIACGAAGEVLGALHAAAALTHLWRWNLDPAYDAGGAAVALLPPGGVAWYRALIARTLVAGIRGAQDDIAGLLELTARTPPLPGAEAVFFEQASTGVFSLCMTGRQAQVEALLERLGAVHARLAAEEAHARAMFQLNLFPYHFYLQGDLWSSHRVAVDMAANYRLAGDDRYLPIAQGNVGITLAEMGAAEDGLAHLRAAIQLLERMGEELGSSVIKAPMALVLATLDRPEHHDEALDLAAEVLAMSQGPNLWAGEAQMARAWVRLAQGDLAAAEHEARQALTRLVASLPARPLALALLCRALLGQGRLDEARQAADEGCALLEALGGRCWTDLWLLVAAAEVRHAVGVHEEAVQALRHAERRLAERVEPIPDTALRERLLGQALSTRVRELARRWEG